MTEASRPERGATPHPLPPDLLHDLRTPLNQIIGYSEMLLEQAQKQEGGEFFSDLQKTRAAGKQLLALIDNNFQAIHPPDPRAGGATLSEIPTTSLEGTPAVARSGQAAVAGPVQGVVLVVDDIEANRDVLARHLKRLGYATALAENGQEALEKLRAETFDVVLLDIMMPEIDGYEVLKQIQADKSLRHVPVIMISALSELESVVHCIEMGAEDYLPKPFNATLLKARLGACLLKKRAHDREGQLFAQVQSQNREMATWRKAQEADLALARTTQQAIVTSGRPLLEGWEIETVYTPLIQVGGDVYGWRQFEDGTSLFWLADVTGHGVAAALLTTLVTLLFDHASDTSQSPHEILSRVNSEFYSVLRGHSLMTACCAVIADDGRLKFAGAGHPPLLVRRLAGDVEAVPSLTTMIGIHPTMEARETLVTLAPGDVALFYTDGLYSSRSSDGERLNGLSVEEAFGKMDANAGFLARLAAQLNPQSSSDDDLAAVALRRA